MGIEYRHFLVVDDPAWLPAADTAIRVDAVLRRWSLVAQLQRVVDISEGTQKSVGAVDPASVQVGSGTVFIYAGIKGESVERIAGANDLDTDGRYTMRISLVLGDDYRIQWSSESIYFELIEGPTVEGRPVAANEGDDDSPIDTLYARSFPSKGALPPVVRIHVEDHAKPNVAWTHCQGFWRGALVIAFGKDLPPFYRVVHALPARDFVADVAEAFRGRLVEIGEFY